MKEYLLGSSYYPEWWDESEWEADFSKMEALGLNCVRMGEFAWSWYEPCEGEYDFEPMRRAMDCAHRHKIKVILGTTTAVCPAWLYKKYPTVKGSNKNGHYDFGGRKGQCLSDEHFLEYARKITTEQAKALGDHPALIGWQLDNEPGFPFSDFDPACAREFRNFLREKYGDIDALNRAWFTMEWSNVYGSFDEIDIPVNSSEGGWTLQIQLDYRKFFSRNFHRLLHMESDIVRKYSPNRFVYTNWPGANWSVNCFEACGTYLDFAAWDNYVGQPNGENYRIQLRAAMEHAFNRRLDAGEKRRFLVAEQPACADANTLPEVIAAQTWLDIAYGAFGTVFFEWRAPLGGAEQDYKCLLGPDCNFREETLPVFKKLASDIKKVYPRLAQSKTVSPAAAVYSYENSWGTSGWVVDGFYDEEFFNLYGGFQNALRNNIDIVSIDDELSEYKLLLLPNFRIASPEQAEKLTEYVKNGGVLVLNTACGIRDEFNRSRTVLRPGLFAELAGASAVSQTTADTILSQTGKALTVSFGPEERSVRSRADVLKLSGAEPLASYSGGRLTGSAAVTVNKVGNGYCILFATDGNDIYYYESLAKSVGKYCRIAPLLPDAEDGILLSSRETAGSSFVFAVNMKDRGLTLSLPSEATDILSGRKMRGNVTLSAYETAVFEFKK